MHSVAAESGGMGKGRAMRGLIILAVIVLLLIIVGWISFSDAPDRSTITIEKEAIREDTADMVRQGNELIEDARRAVAPDENEAEQEATAPSAQETLEPSTQQRSGAATSAEPLAAPEEPAQQPPVETTR